MTRGKVIGRIQIAGAAQHCAPQAYRHHGNNMIPTEDRVRQSAQETTGHAFAGMGEHW
jgi:hypothetical protein